MKQRSTARKQTPSQTDQSGIPIEVARDRLDEAARAIFSDPRVRSVGIAEHGTAYGYRAVRNSAMIVAQGAMLRATRSLTNFDLPVTYVDTPQEVEHQVRVPFRGPAAPSVVSHVLEQGRVRPLVSGLQIQNFDDDIRTGEIAQGLIIVGTLGCFVDLSDGSVAILSNNHVVAGENRGIKGTDRIQQSGSGTFNASDLAGVLNDFVALRVSPANASIVAGNAILNQVDAGVAALAAGISFNQGFLPTRALSAPTGVAAPRLGDKVFKVGRTTGLTHGEIKDVATIVGPVTYDPGPCWFEQSMTIEGDNGTMFSDKGDSGSIIVRTDGKIVGLLYAGNGIQTYACPISLVFSALGCSLH